MSGVIEFELVLAVRNNLCPEVEEHEINLDSENQLGGEDYET